MKLKSVFGLCVASTVCFGLAVGCGHAKSSPAANLSYTQADPGTFSAAPDVRVVGLGEASHGVAQYQQMKAEVFKALVKNNDCRSFIIEGDFGGALKADQYINGGDGTAEAAVAEIGFKIYRTREMADLAEWMRSYNEKVSKEKALHFYGMDVQRFDNNKEYLFSVLDRTHPELSAEYSEAFAGLTDESRASLDKAALTQAKEQALALIDKLDAVEAEVAERVGQSDFDFARECAMSIYAGCEVLLSDNYNEVRERYMFEKLEWFLQHGDGSLLFINGHNGHIAKSSVANYTCLGELLSDKLGSGYYALGTDAQKTQFNAQKDDGTFETMEVSNSNDLNHQLSGAEGASYFIDFAAAASDKTWKQIMSSEQSITTLNVGLSGIQKMLKAAYTAKIIPKDSFDGMIVFRAVTPSSLLGE